MNGFYSRALAAAGLNLLLFLLLFTLLQQEPIYRHSLGLISKNYERSGAYGHDRIEQVSKPFLQITENRLENWDASIYNCLRENGYDRGDGCYEKVRPAFFPLFPFLWKFLHVNARGICLVNYVLFAVSLAVLVNYFFNGTNREKLLLYALCVSLPSSIIYFIPYSEAAFLFTMTLAIIGKFKDRYWIFFTGIFLLSMTRPATLFLLAAFMFIDTIRLLRGLPFKFYLKEMLLTVFPFFTGYVVVLFLQFLSCHSWTALIDAQQFWQSGTWSEWKISDWSAEGFGLSSFSIFIVCLPALFYTVRLLFKSIPKSPGGSEAKDHKDIREYLFQIATAYLSLLLLYVLVYKGGSMQSFFRYTITTPLFFIASIHFFTVLQSKSMTFRISVFLPAIAGLVIFLGVTEFGGSRFTFQFAGMYLFLACMVFYINGFSLKNKIMRILLSLLWIANTVWSAYLLNMFLSEAWVFT